MTVARGRALGIGVLAVLAGAAFLFVAGAPAGLIVRNLVAFAAGLALGTIGLAFQPPRVPPFLPRLALTVVMLVIVLLVGVSVDGVQRWIRFGPVTLQPALILLPTLFSTLGDDRGGWRRAALLVPAGLIALQPDAGTLFALALTLWILRRFDPARPALIAALGATALTAWCLLDYANPEPVRFVEATAALALETGPLAIALHLTASLLMLVPFVLHRSREGWALLTFFAALATAAVLGAFPMPVAGAAVSPLVGYGAALALLFLPIRSVFRRP